MSGEKAFNSEVQEVVKRIKQRQWLATLRPVDVFVHPSKFSRPQTMAEVNDRVGVNIEYFGSNYVLFCLIVVTTVVIAKPSLLLIASVLVVLWYAYADLRAMAVDTVLSPTGLPRHG